MPEISNIENLRELVNEFGWLFKARVELIAAFPVTRPLSYQLALEFRSVPSLIRVVIVSLPFRLIPRKIVRMIKMALALGCRRALRNTKIP